MMGHENTLTFPVRNVFLRKSDKHKKKRDEEKPERKRHFGMTDRENVIKVIEKRSRTSERPKRRRDRDRESEQWVA